MSAAAAVPVALGASVGLGLLLYLAVRAESGDREATTRADAERVARRDTDGTDASGHGRRER